MYCAMIATFVAATMFGFFVVGPHCFPAARQSHDQFLSKSFAVSPVLTPSGASRASVSMDFRKNKNYLLNKKTGNTQGDYGWQAKKKENTKVDASLLKGYTVGSRAPPTAVRSGTTIAEQFGRFTGGARKDKSYDAQKKAR